MPCSCRLLTGNLSFYRAPSSSFVVIVLRTYGSMGYRVPRRTGLSESDSPIDLGQLQDEYHEVLRTHGQDLLWLDLFVRRRIRIRPPQQGSRPQV